ncbi:hypothetical protein EVAR_46293_1 [Eumeta japonica]|uniref:Uncharacterized protein n=1 Tax=Eumeta variegata TaxID=151549 RepID=A0A4C1XY43_EUMVA|nr:hypothetical protein EVAR_46293_1 [Eumeta japonica]
MKRTRTHRPECRTTDLATLSFRFYSRATFARRRRHTAAGRVSPSFSVAINQSLPACSDRSRVPRNLHRESRKTAGNECRGRVGRSLDAGSRAFLW